MADPNLDLESFRQRWREEVDARHQKEKAKAEAEAQALEADRFTTRAGRTDAATRGPSGSYSAGLGDDENSPEAATGRDGDVDVDVDVDVEDGRHSPPNEPGVFGDLASGHAKHPPEPQSALEHYERGVEKENQGSLGDSLNHYRLAYRLDASVDKAYKNKYHAAPCAMATLPYEVLVEICLQLALLDLSSFASLAQVCKRLAYIFAAEEPIWRRVCCGAEIGFGAMHYRWACDISGRPLDADDSDGDVDEDSRADPRSSALARRPPTYLTHLALTPAYASYQQTLRHRPRIRFHGCYISTVNYMRPGGGAVSQVSWNAAVLIVTYYRYLRFFRDGSVISLLTTAEPLEVVPLLTKENVPPRPAAAGASTPAVMACALRGRWRLGPLDLPSSGSSAARPPPPPPAIAMPSSAATDDGLIVIETEGGANPSKYMYRMHLSLTSATPRKSSNNQRKISWRAFWSYNRLTDDWAEFGLKNDRPFWWSRVKGYGRG
ncbi:MAG: hypothetical protein M1826_007557 [Phylliscum demangeonii]|nr:MAG: hypothetical protein M1826_007557 [Phylliscum demangeonii]